MSRALDPQPNVSGPADDLAVLSIDGIRLLLTQRAIRSLEPALDVEAGRGTEGAAGLLWFEGEQWPVYCLGPGLRALDRIPEVRRVCVVLGAAQGYACLLCDGVRMLKRKETNITPLPVCMNPDNNPFHGLAVLDQGVGCLTSVDKLVAYVRASAGGSYPETAEEASDCQPGRGLG